MGNILLSEDQEQIQGAGQAVSHIPQSIPLNYVPAESSPLHTVAERQET